jgi:uncharacterized membrane protein
MIRLIFGVVMFGGSLVGLGLNHKKRVKKESKIDRIKRNVKVKCWKIVK